MAPDTSFSRANRTGAEIDFVIPRAANAMPTGRVGMTTLPVSAAAVSARAMNAAIPFATTSLVPARPFQWTGSFEDFRRAVDCLAAAAWYEAGSGALDQRAVAQTVLNRVRHSAFPNSVCSVVFEGSQRRTGCQFTFTCDGSLYSRRPSARAWEEARNMAEQMLFGRVELAVGQSTHYHTDWVAPPWSRDMSKIAAVGTHLFFRWRGSAGDANAFKQPLASEEPRIALLASLSPTHAANGRSTEAVALPEVSVAPPASNPSSALLPSVSRRIERERLPDRSSRPDAEVFLVSLSAASEPDSFLQLAQQACSGLTHCRFVGWTDPGRKAEQLPMPGTAVDAISFTYVRRAGSEAGVAHWNCAEFPRADQSQCLHRAI